jgi:hypothetical protein
MLTRALFRPFQKKLEKVPAGRLLVWGELEDGERSFGPEDLLGLDAEFQAPDVSKYKEGFVGRAVRLAGLLAICKPRSGPLYLNAASRDGRKRLSFWIKEVEPLAWIVYEPEQRALSGNDAGPFQLVLPGFHGRRESLGDLAMIEIGSHSEPERFS